jgi:hypothetical protein
VLKLIEEEARNNLWQKILEIDLSNPDNLKTLEENQVYVKARADFLHNIKKHTAEIYNPIDGLK